ncbi:major facilitator superfamily domain-containing protein [Kockovaella imperatae]|uniref:Major facilitator superfamily domain-containing protein n=1 Tax=Kockovaella imperatae TaxID=4999 RepID=A0A1Y1UAL3_9TREE|nr:major facilitator superfamily domain-containing protein [Kockovaella imperatae]ORX35091.1 major facilitator superfamily domain-containing protein [Kockovaella imperatae]
MDNKRDVFEGESPPVEYSDTSGGPDSDPQPVSLLSWTFSFAKVFLLLLSYFLSQYDKFIISYFQQDVVVDLNISSAGYGALTGYGTSVLSSFAVIPIAIFTDSSQARVWALTITILWWSLMVIFQSLCHEFWQVILARLAMFLGQSASEALAVSLIADILPARFVGIGESVLYVGVYIGEAISSRISSVFIEQDKSWRLAFRAIGITGLVLAVATRLIVREPQNKRRIILGHAQSPGRHLIASISEVWQTARYIMALESFWIITFSCAWRQFAGNIFGYYLPTLLQLQYPDQVAYEVATYGTIVGAVGSTACMTGGILTSFLSPRYPNIALHLTAWGGAISWPFVVTLTFSRTLASTPEGGLRILFGCLSAAYITAELWLGAMASLIVSLLPIRYKTLGYAIFALSQLLIWSAGPEIVSIAQYRAGVDTSDIPSYIETTRIILCVLIPFGYCACAFGLGIVIFTGKFKRDLARVRAAASEHATIEDVALSKKRTGAFGIGLGVLGAIVVGLTATSYALGT